MLRILAIVTVGALVAQPAPTMTTIEPPGSISLTPRTVHVLPAESCTLTVFFDSEIDSLGCVECVITFDTTLVELVSIDEGRLFEESTFGSFLVTSGTETDTVTAVDCALGYRSYVLPPGELLRFVFEAKQSGVCPVRIVGSRMWDINRLQLQHIVDPYAYIYVDGVAAGVAAVPTAVGCLESYPNPFNPYTTLVFTLPGDGEATFDTESTVAIYSADGRRVRTLFRGRMHTGANRFEWNGRDQRGDPVGSGVYFALVRTEKEVYKTKVVLVR